jgi:chemotaxis protein methyltransferase WspC
VDISQHALARAKHAVYGKNSFRGTDVAFRDRHFRHTKDGFALSPGVRQCVRFHRDNLLGETFLADCAPYDFIFCRNLLIYFDRATQTKALEKLHHLLKPAGVLFVGPAELPLVAGTGFVSANLPMAFACRKSSVRPDSLEAVEPRPVIHPQTPLAPAVAHLQKADLEPRRGQDRAHRRQSSARATAIAPSELDAARQLADAGRLEEAAAICESHLRKEGPSAQVYYLLGLLCDARGDIKASDYYRKALYLEPNHYETLVHMSLLLERSGDSAGARAFKRRAERVQPDPARLPQRTG